MVSSRAHVFTGLAVAADVSSSCASPHTEPPAHPTPLPLSDEEMTLLISLAQRIEPAQR